MIDYGLLCQTIEQWQAGQRPPSGPHAAASGSYADAPVQTETVEEMDSDMVMIEDVESAELSEAATPPAYPSDADEGGEFGDAQPDVEYADHGGEHEDDPPDGEYVDPAGDHGDDQPVADGSEEASEDPEPEPETEEPGYAEQPAEHELEAEPELADDAEEDAEEDIPVETDED